MSYRTDDVEEPHLPNEECPDCEALGMVHADYPHDAGYLYDCFACEDHCHCGRAEGRPKPGLAACVFADCQDEED